MPFLPVGGQAVIEGVMMRSPSKIAVAVRRPDGTLGYFDRAFTSISRRVPLLRLPVIRGAVSLFETLGLGIQALNFSADEASRDEPAKEAKPASLGAQIGQVAVVAVSFGLGLLLFVVLPARATEWLGFHSRIGFGLVDGLFRLVAFVLYLTLVSQWREMARVLGYHGAEHKAIHALEADAPLTPESVQSFSRFHPRCGTSFLFLVVMVSIVVFAFIGKPRGLGDHLLRIACMPVIVGIAFEFIRISGKYTSHPLVRLLIWPGLQFQRLTTREPDLGMCAVAIASLQRVTDDETVRKLQQAGSHARLEVEFMQ
ncbi:MAG: DUF1385 domain-containing protein [Candidatus Eisenbacteria bacterium]|uniref:DUF1385 domain-containing protein n=1 Tax=Eiseniibacteriota bacterium TaxID=2212470 RepID=A0A849SFN6_UNCEI|nr:DUF1385 domain-containing protein [Candidatus Eisenbacteria bacterium]